MTAIEKAAAAIANARNCRNGSIPIDGILELLSPKLRTEATEDARAVLVAVRHEDLLKALVAAAHALRSYQYGNAAPALAEGTAVLIEALVADAEGK